MSERSTAVLEKVVEMIDGELEHIKEEMAGGRLGYNQARILAEYGRTLSVIDKNLAVQGKERDQETKAMTDEELEAALLKAAQEIKHERQRRA